MSDPYAPPAAETEIDIDELAGRWRRLFGALIDNLIISGVIAWGLMFATGLWDAALAGTATFMDQLPVFVGSFVIHMLVQAYPLATRGQTIGKMAVGTQIVSVETDEILPLGTVIGLRYLPVSVAGMIPLIGFILVIVDALFIFREDKRCVHDLIAKTKVVMYEKGEA